MDVSLPPQADRPDADHRVAERAFLAAGWTPCGAGDWAIALRSPDGTAAARISPFDPTGPYTAALYREAAHTRLVPSCSRTAVSSAAATCR
jgi:hypothetical protein